MKIHNPNDLEFDPQTLRALARGDLDPVRLAVEDHQRVRAKSLAEVVGQELITKPARNLPAGLARSAGKLASVEPPPATRNAGSARQSKAKNPGAVSARTPEERQAEYEQLMRKRQQLTGIIRECEALEVVNYEVLALKHYPDAAALAAARRRRDLWLMCCLLCTAMAIVGWLGFLAAWLAGVAFGVLVLLLALALKPFRTLFYQLPTHTVLKSTRKAMEFKALNHIKMLEGRYGLAWQCQRMDGYGPALSDKRFQRLVLLSKQGILIKAMRTVAAMRLYLSYLLAAQQAFVLVKQEYMTTSTRLQREFADLSLEHSR